MKYEQVFENGFSILVYLNGDSSESYSIMHPDIGSCYSVSSALGVFEQHYFPVDIRDAFEYVNLVQEVLALANTKNLSTELLFDLGYVEVI